MATRVRKPKQLPDFVRISHGAYHHVRWNPAAKKVIWTWLARLDNYPGMLSALSRLETDHAHTMAAVFDRYQVDIADKQSRNTRVQKTWMLKILRESFGRMRAQDITPQLVYRFLDEYGADAPICANNLVSVLCHVFKKAIRWGLADTNPATDIEKFPQKPRRRYITDAEYETVVAAVAERWRPVIELTFLTGQRIGDVLALKWSEVRADGVYFRQQKTGVEVIVERSPELDRVIASLRQVKVKGLTVVVDERGQPFPYQRIYRVFTRAVKALVATGALASAVTIHDLRRKAGSDVDADSELLGHISKVTRDRVYRVAPRRARPTR